MSNIELMSKAVDFVEDSLKKAIAVSDVAEAVSCSLYHFCRTFNQVTHHTPYDYLMRRRLSESARELLQTDRKIIDVAFDYRFNSPETFCRAFKRMFGVQPNRLRRQRAIDSRRVMPRLTTAHLEQIGKGAYLKPVLEEKGAFRLAGVMTPVRHARPAISELWELFGRELENAGGLVKPINYYGITCYPEDWDNRGFLYMAAVEVQGPDVADVALVVKTIPALKYARFIHKGTMQELQLTLDYIYHTWLPKSGRCISYSMVVEHYGEDFGKPTGKKSEWEVYIPISEATLVVAQRADDGPGGGA